MSVERYEAPELIITENTKRRVTVKAGNTLNLLLAYKGRPAPTVTWSKADTKVSVFNVNKYISLSVCLTPPHFKDDVLKKRADIDTNELQTSLVINDANRFDAGNYMVNIENNQGSKDFVFSVKVRQEC